MPNLISSMSLSATYKHDYINMKHDYILHELNLIEARPNLKIYTSLNDEYLLIKIANILYLDKIETVAFAALEPINDYGEFGYQIKLTKSFVKNQGLMNYIFKFILFELDEIIYSDSIHTLPGSMDLWKNLRNRQNIWIESINTDSNAVEIYNDQEDCEIWGVDPLDYQRNGLFDLGLLTLMREDNLMSSQLHDYIINNHLTLADKGNIILRVKPKLLNLL